MRREPGTEITCYQCGHKWKNKYRHIPFCPQCKHVGFNWEPVPDLDGEVWRESSLAKGRLISNYGRLKSSVSGNAMYVGKLIKGVIDRCGYIRHRNGKGGVFAHVLMAHEFIGPKPEGYECNHKDGNKLNNHVSNIEYLTRKDHRKHSVVNDLVPYGERHGMVKLSERDVLDILDLRKQGITHAAIGKRFNVDESNISCITRGVTWKRTVAHEARC